MYRAALRSSSARVAARAVACQPAGFSAASRRMASTAAAPGKSTWKGTALRWGAAIGGLYWYNTSPIFADEATHQIIDPPEVSAVELQTVDAVLEDKRKQDALKAEKAAAAKAEAVAKKSDTDAESTKQAVGGAVGDAQSPEALEEEAGQQGAFNPETGEINWDCPCLGGMAHGPCGEEFRLAFSCFVFSEVDPKGMDCIDKFQHMQDCFRQYPEIYGAELQDDELDEKNDPTIEGVAAAAPSEPVDGAAAAPAAKIDTATKLPDAATVKEAVGEEVKEKSKAVKESVEVQADALKEKSDAVKKAVAESAAPAVEATKGAVATAEKEAQKVNDSVVAAVETAKKNVAEKVNKEQVHGGDDGFGDTSLPKAAFDATASK